MQINWLLQISHLKKCAFLQQTSACIFPLRRMNFERRRVCPERKSKWSGGESIPEPLGRGGGAVFGEHPAPLRICGLVAAAGTLERRIQTLTLEWFTRSKFPAVPRIQPRMSRDPVSMFSRSERAPELQLRDRIRCRGFRFFP